MTAIEEKLEKQVAALRAALSELEGFIDHSVADFSDPVRVAARAALADTAPADAWGDDEHERIVKERTRLLSAERDEERTRATAAEKQVAWMWSVLKDVREDLDERAVDGVVAVGASTYRRLLDTLADVKPATGWCRVSDVERIMRPLIDAGVRYRGDQGVWPTRSVLDARTFLDGLREK